MNLLNKTVSFVAVMACIPAAFAVTARPSVTTAAASRLRMPTMSLSSSVTGTTSTSGSSSSSTLLAGAECIDAYRECIEADDACGPDFAECTNRVLFHVHMPKCISTLAQCNASGITSLFGTSSTTALSDGKVTATTGEITDYTYPLESSVLGQMITAAEIANRYDTSTCVKRYTSCLKKDSVCGNDFELCTTDKEFKTQKLFCESTLARCQGEGKMELFGKTDTTSAPTASSRLGVMISEGAALAAINAVSTCYKVVDQCILNACAKNPFKCMDGSSDLSTKLADAINNGTTITDDMLANLANNINNAQVSGYIRGACMDTIGSNKYCYATFLGEGKMPTASELRDADNQEMVYDEAYGARMNAAMKAKLSDLINKFDTTAKTKCSDTIKSCAMRACGDGNGAVCYSTVFGNASKSINGTATYDEIKTGCADIVNTDLYCKYAAANISGSGEYVYMFSDDTAFGKLFPAYDATSASNDPISVVSALNATLANSFNDAVLAQKKKQCQTVATSCVKSMCGSDYVNCYRNRTDIYSSLTNTGDTSFDNSMNKVGGVLDYTIVLGLCLDTVKNASVCEDHLAIEAAKLTVKNDGSTSVWGDATSVRGGWIDAGGATSIEAELDERIAMLDDNGNPLCRNKTTMAQGTCGEMDENGNIYDEPLYIDTYTYHQSQAASTLFRDLIYDLDKEAQAKYNAKITREQNMCMSSNAGGIMGNKDHGSTYMWVKLRSKKVPNDYTVRGLETNDYIASNDLYGSFCRIRVTLHSDDRDIQKILEKGQKWANGYFAVGDTFSCGSWIPSEDLEEIANEISCTRANGKWENDKCSVGDQALKTRGWLTAVGALGTAIGGGFLGDAIANGDVMGGLTGLGDNKVNDNQKAANMCQQYATEAKNKATSSATVADITTAQRNLDRALTYAKNLNVSKDVRDAAEDALDAMTTTNASSQYSIVVGALDDLIAECEYMTEDNQTKNKGKRVLGASLGAALTGAAGGLTVYYATKDIQESNLTAEQKTAYEEWMNSIGKHIYCYIGGEEAGTYGDMITTSLE